MINLGPVIIGPELVRKWINQPSTLQPHHKYHGRNVLCFEPTGHVNNNVMVWFTDGPSPTWPESIEVDRSALSKGWLKRTAEQG